MNNPILPQIRTPQDVKALSEDELQTLCGEVRQTLIAVTAKNGGHLASNLGAVELTVALHRVYDPEKDRILFDVGHQAYVHKLLTGRKDRISLQSRGRSSAGTAQRSEWLLIDSNMFKMMTSLFFGRQS